MKKTSIVEAFISFKDWFAVKFLRRSQIYQPFSLILNETYKKIIIRPSASHFTILKIAKGIIGFIPVGLFSYYFGYEKANKTNFNNFIKYLRSEDEIYSLLEAGKPVVTFLYLPGEIFSESAHPHFHKIAYENYQ